MEKENKSIYFSFTHHSNYPNKPQRLICISLITFFILLSSLPAYAQTIANTDASASSQSNSATYYVDPKLGNDGNPGTQAQPWQTLQKANKSISPGDTVILADGIYKMDPNTFADKKFFYFTVSGVDMGHKTTYKAAPGARPIVTSITEQPVNIQINATNVHIEGIWFGGSWDPLGGLVCNPGSWNGDNPVFNIEGPGNELVNDTFFGYNQTAGGHDWLLYQGNRSVLTGGGTLSHGLYESGNSLNYPEYNHDIVDDNIFLGEEVSNPNYSSSCGPKTFVPGLGIQFWHVHRNAIITRNFVAHHIANVDDGPNDTNLNYRSELIANNFWYDDGTASGWSSGTPGAGWLINPHEIYQNNVHGHRSNISGGADTRTNRNGNTISYNAFSANEANYITNDATTFFYPEASIPQGFGLTEPQLDTIISNLQQSFSVGKNGVTIESLHNDQSVEPNFAALHFHVPASSPFYQAGRAWFNAANPGQPPAPSATVNLGPDVAVPNSAGGFWAAFRALGMQEFDDNGNFFTAPYSTYPYPASAAPTDTPTVAPTFTVTAKPSPTNTSTMTPTATATRTFTPSATPTNMQTFTATATGTLATPTITPTIPSASVDTVGAYRGSVASFLQRYTNTTGYSNNTFVFQYGSNPYPVVGDWTGQGIDTVALFDEANAQFFLRNANNAGTPDEQFVYGNPGDEPIAGKWTASSGHDGIGVYRSSNGLLLLRNSLSSGFADYVIVLGIPSDQGLAGDWKGQGFDSPGVYRPSNQMFFLSNEVCNCNLNADYTLQYGNPGDEPLAGDWIGQGHAGIGVFRPNGNLFLLKNQLQAGPADITFSFGRPDDIPIMGHWSASVAAANAPGVMVPSTSVPVYNKPPAQNLGG